MKLHKVKLITFALVVYAVSVSFICAADVINADQSAIVSSVRLGGSKIHLRLTGSGLGTAAATSSAEIWVTDELNAAGNVAIPAGVSLRITGLEAVPAVVDVVTPLPGANNILFYDITAHLGSVVRDTMVRVVNDNGTIVGAGFAFH